jgi:outer membrane protein assembly factor BamE (lipoprotein component of BamABCDE complex)
MLCIYKVYPGHNDGSLTMLLRFKILSVSFACLLACACVSTGPEEITGSGTTAQLETCHSTQAEVSALLGCPALVTYGPKGEETWSYYYVTEYPQAIAFIPAVAAAAPGGRQSTRELTISFDRQGVAREFQRRHLVSLAGVNPY